MSSARLRPAKPEDHGQYVRFFAELGTPEGPLERERWTKESLACSAFLHDSNADIGYASWELAGEIVHVRHVVIDPSKRGQGLGRRLMLELAQLLRSKGAQAWRLNVFSANKPAIALYESVGLDVIYASVALRLDWDKVALLPRLNSISTDSDPAFDSTNETKFALLQGQLGRAREKQGVKIVAAKTLDGVQVGVAAFDPSIPGAFPFRCKPPEHARTLIEGLRERYDGEKPFVQLVIEDSASMTRALEAAGAERVRDIVHMRGAIPR